MNSNKALNQIAVFNEKLGIGEIDEPVDIAKYYKSGDAHTVMIEWTDRDTDTDHLVELSGITHYRQQSRQTLYPKDQEKKGKDGGGDPAEEDRLRRELTRLKNKHREIIADDERKTKLIDKLTDENQDALSKLAKLEEAEKNRKTIGSVEVWTYDSTGLVADHIILTTDDFGEEIPIGNVVVELKKEDQA